jgi:hypothetical protein
MNQDYIPKQVAGNLVVLDESVTGIADILVAPPYGRWVALHNTHDTAVSIFAPENEVFRYIAENGDARADVNGPGNTGKLAADESILSSTTVTEGTTASFDSSGTVTVTRNGVDVTSQVTAPSFDGIAVATGAATAIAVNAEGAGLEEGDVITFPLTTATDVSLSITVAENDLQLSAGFYTLKVTTRKKIRTLAAGETVYVNVSKVEIQADDDQDNATVTGYFG